MKSGISQKLKKQWIYNMDNYQIVPMYTKNAMKRNVISGYKVVNR